MMENLTMGTKAQVANDDVRAERPSNHHHRVIQQKTVYGAKYIQQAIDNEIEAIYFYDKFENIVIGFLTEFSNSQFKSLAIRKPFLGLKLNSTSYNLLRKFELLLHLLRKFQPSLQLAIGKKILKQISRMIIEKDKWFVPCFLTLTEIWDSIQVYQNNCHCFNKSLPYKAIKRRVDEFSAFLESLEVLNFQRANFDESSMNNESAIETAINTEETQIVKRLGCLASYYKEVIIHGGVPRYNNPQRQMMPTMQRLPNQTNSNIVNEKPPNTVQSNPYPTANDPNSVNSANQQRLERDMMMDAMRMYKNQAIKVSKLFLPPTPPPSKHDLINDDLEMISEHYGEFHKLIKTKA